ncbi:MAG: hypothetical protein ACE5O2_11585, partial [Armatimonadota bacterium]
MTPRSVRRMAMLLAAVGLAAGRPHGIAFGQPFLKARRLLSIVGYSPGRRFVRPTGLAVDERGRALYVADPDQGEIAVFTLQGAPTFVIKEGAGFRPVAICTRASGELLVLDERENAVKALVKRELRVRLRLSDGASSDPPNISRMAVDSRGNLYLVDQRNCRIL